MPEPHKSKADASSDQSKDVFLNVPFDDEFEPLLRAAVFAIAACGYNARCALETFDSGIPRFHRIIELIRECRLSIHDFSRTDADPLPRFNMPFEFGLALGARYFGDESQRKRSCLLMAKERYEFQKFISDISGHDIKDHQDKPEKVIAHVRNFLLGDVKDRSIPGASKITALYENFTATLSALYQEMESDLKKDEWQFANYSRAIYLFLKKRNA